MGNYAHIDTTYKLFTCVYLFAKQKIETDYLFYKLWYA